jgi:hypothetical protein|tara:strand:+ start:356 stop:640 length:285 start_codon:yes stop_codon:yes gene_type:complete
MSKIKGLVMDLESKLSDSQTEIRKARRKLRGLGVTVEEIHQPNPDVDEDISTNLNERIRDAKVVLQGLESLVETAEAMVKVFGREDLVEETKKP